MQLVIAILKGKLSMRYIMQRIEAELGNEPVLRKLVGVYHEHLGKLLGC